MGFFPARNNMFGDTRYLVGLWITCLYYMFSGFTYLFYLNNIFP